MTDKLNQFVILLKVNLRLLLSISLGIFIFVLFFEPFPLDQFEFNSRLQLIAGLAVIIFLSMVLVRVFFPWLINKHFQEREEAHFSEFAHSFVMLLISALSFSFYLRYVGQVDITFHIMFKVIILCLSPPLLLRLHDDFRNMQKQNENLKKEKKKIRDEADLCKDNLETKSIELVSENRTDKVAFIVSDIVYAKSADNYVEIVFKENDIFKKKLIRNTLKNIELQLSPFSTFMRCHRTCLVNIRFVNKLGKNYNSQWVSILGSEETLPVSRQYLLQLKELF